VFKDSKMTFDLVDPSSTPNPNHYDDGSLGNYELELFLEWGKMKSAHKSVQAKCLLALMAQC